MPGPEIGDVVDRHDAVDGAHHSRRARHIDKGDDGSGDVHGDRSLGQGGELGAGRRVGDAAEACPIRVDRVDVAVELGARIFVRAAEGQLEAIVPPVEIDRQVVRVGVGPEHVVVRAIRINQADIGCGTVDIGDDAHVVRQVTRDRPPRPRESWTPAAGQPAAGPGWRPARLPLSTLPVVRATRRVVTICTLRCSRDAPFRREQAGGPEAAPRKVGQQPAATRDES